MTEAAVLPRAFISYARADRPFAFRLAVDLTRAGLNVWYDQWEILPGDSIVEKIESALHAHDTLLVVLSPDAINSRWVRRELSSSLMASLAGREVKVLPVMRSQCELPTLIADLRYADFTHSYESGFAELLASFGLARRVPAYTSRPRPVTELELDSADGPVKTLFPHTFADWPDCVLGSGPDLDALVVVGSTTRERSGDAELFAERTVEADVFGTRWSLARQASAGTVRDVVRVADLSAFLTQAKLSSRHEAMALDDALCVADISVTANHLRRNLILVGAADTNLFFGFVTVAYRQRFGYSIPMRYTGDDQLYFTCDQIVSDLSGLTYERLEESGHMHCGFLVMLPNPWAPDKVVVLASGTRATGTQATLLALLRGSAESGPQRRRAELWHHLSGNNRYNQAVPAKIVRATRALVARGPALFAEQEDLLIPPHERIPQRHIVTDFEFLE